MRRLVGVVVLAMLAASAAAGATDGVPAQPTPDAASAPRPDEPDPPQPGTAVAPRPSVVVAPRPGVVVAPRPSVVVAPRPDVAVAPRPGAVIALVRAAGDADPKRLDALLRSGASVNVRTPRNETPLQIAASAGLVSNVFALLSRGAEIDATAARGTTALGWAARNGHDAVVRTLLDAGANPDAAADPEHAPITLAARGDYDSIASLLIERGSRVFVDPALAGAVMVALGEADSAELAAALVPRMAGLLATSAAFREAAADAIVSSNATSAHVLRRLLGAATEAREFQTTLLLTAARRKRPDIAATAVAHGADVNARHPVLGTPLAGAVAMSDADTVAILLAAGADWTTASAAPPGAPAAAAATATAAASAAAAASDRMQQIADERRHELRLAELIGSLDSPEVRDVRDRDGLTPLFLFAQRGDVGAVSTLLRQRVHPAATVRRWQGDEGWTALMTAAANGHVAVVELLLGAGAPVDQRNGAGRTALGFAAFYGRAQAVVVLLRAGAAPDTADRIGLTPKRLAEAGGEPVTVALLRNVGRPADGAPSSSGAPQ